MVFTPSAFDTYSTPHPSTRYSATYFGEITFKQATTLTFPVIYEPDSIAAWTFTDEIPTDAETKLQPGEGVPDIADLASILREMEQAFSEGTRSVTVTIRVSGKPIIRLFRNLNNNKIAVHSARALAIHLSSIPLVSPVLLDRFLDLPICRPIFGFCVTDFPLWKLSCLLREEWLHEDVLNALAELLYFSQAANSTSDAPSTLILPTHFLNDAKYLFDQSPPFFSPNLIALRRRLEVTSVDKISVFNCHSSHYSAYTASGSSQLGYGDSMQRTPDSNVLSIFQWLLSESSFTTPTAVEPSHVPPQGPGSGSCGIAALNFVETDLNTGVQVGRWTTSTSPFFRNRAIRDLILYHLTASSHSGEESYEKWVTPCVPSPRQDTSVDYGPVGYNDFNLDAPNVFHPIHRFLRLVHQQTTSEMIDSIREPKPTTMFTSLSAPSQFDVEADRKSPRPQDSSSVPLWSPFTELPRMPASRIMLDLASTPERSMSEIIDLCTPSPAPLRMAPKTEIIDDIIDLSFSPEDQKPTHSLPRRVLTFKSDVDIVTLDSDVTCPTGFGSERENLNPSEDHSPLAARPTLETVDVVRMGSFFATFEQGQAAVYAREERLGHIWRTGQTKRANDGSVRRITLRCNHYGDPNAATHRNDIDPSDHRAGRTIRTNCCAHVNLASVAGGGWHVTVIDWTHNHPPQVPHQSDAVGGRIPRPPTQDQRDLVSRYATSGNFTRGHLSHILRSRFPDNVLEPRQISNLINAARREATDQVNALGGDVQSVLTRLRELKEEDPRWDWDVPRGCQFSKNAYRVEKFFFDLLDPPSPPSLALSGSCFDDIKRSRVFEVLQYHNQVVTALWWQSPTQAELSRRFYDVLINDNTYCRNQYGYPLNIGIAIDNFGSTRNVWYAVHRTEDIETHNWVFKNHLRSARRPPEVLGSDRHRSLISSVSNTLPLTFHFFCLHHLGGNIDTNLRSVLSSDWDSFKRDFWVVYNAVSPAEFERLWAAKYLDEELYPCRSQWAWAWISNVFTAGVRTTGRVESENRVNKIIGGPKKTLLQLFNGLNERTEDQTSKDLAQVRQSSRRHHESNLESLFAAPLKLLRDHAGPFALQKCYKQMQDSLFYSTEVVQRPDEVTSWNTGSGLLQAKKTLQQMLNLFNNDKAHVSMQWLISLVTKRGLVVRHILLVKHESTGVMHYVAVLPDGRYICDCCMPSNLGIPCRHFFRIWTDVQNLPFHISLIRPRWLQNPEFAVESVAAVTRNQELGPQELRLPTRTIRSAFASNPLDSTSHETTPPPRTQTIPGRDVFHNVQAAIRPLIAGIQTREQVSDLIHSLQDLQSRTHLLSLIKVGHGPVASPTPEKAASEVAELLVPGAPVPEPNRSSLRVYLLQLRLGPGLGGLTSAVYVVRRGTIEQNVLSSCSLRLILVFIRDDLRQLVTDEVIDRTSPVWGIDEEDELRGCYRSSGQPHLWFAAGNFAISRFFSAKQLALKIKAIELLYNEWAYRKHASSRTDRKNKVLPAIDNQTFYKCINLLWASLLKTEFCDAIDNLVYIPLQLYIMAGARVPDSTAGASAWWEDLKVAVTDMRHADRCWRYDYDIIQNVGWVEQGWSRGAELRAPTPRKQ
ncbi:hypothetical protein GGX14DRAFT_397480 [Mycena pura]|uniref:MULE transposase domain-containing protein n=1 Tax=Mycena pura TaxID=153505 RepID=A0AAD6V980_9AGAR|nr:hypothetical protein GGX14DRAFT_397480 [Mycena pura]